MQLELQQAPATFLQASFPQQEDCYRISMYSKEGTGYK